MSVEIGSYLRQAREAIGMSLEEIQEKTRIQKSFLIAIENGDFHKLPSPFYVRTYLRSYANCVKIEPHHILRQYRKMEQAERLTGVHKAVNEKDLSQTQQLSLQKTGKLPALSGGTGPQKSVSQATGRMPAVGKTVPRTNTQTALTAPRTEMDSARRDKELARRDVGYQRTIGMTGAMRAVSPRPSAKPEKLPTSPESSAQPTARNNPVSETPLHAEKPYHSIPPRRSRELSSTSPNLGSTSKGLSNTGSIPPTKASDAYHSSGNLRASQPHKALQSSKRYETLSQTGSFSRESSSSAPIPRQELEAKEDTELRMLPGASKMQTLSRSAVKNKKAPKMVKFPKSVSIAIASLVLCIPLAWAIVSYIGDDDPSKGADQGQNGTNSAEQTPNTNAKGELKLAEQTANTDYYHLTGAETADIVFEGISGDRSWVQVRKDALTEQNRQNYLKDFMIKNGETVKLTYDFAAGQDLWIILGNPENVSITVNGKTVESAKSINIKQVQ